MAWRPDGLEFASASFDATMKVWDLKSGKVLKSYERLRSSASAL